MYSIAVYTIFIKIRITQMFFTYNKNLFFKSLTFAPLEKDLINENMLTKIEKDYIFSYHLETYSKISAYLNNKERKWLAKLIQ